MRSVCRVVLVRHAQRADEVPDASKTDIPPIAKYRPTAFHCDDPPLTQLGDEQAATAAGHVTDILQPVYDVDRLYSSPFVRCVQTAVPFARNLRLPLIVNPNAGVCAWAYKKALAGGRTPEFLSHSQLRDVAAGVELYCEGPPPSNASAFLPFLEQQARGSSSTSPGRKRAILVVTHREGIRELDRICGLVESTTAPYCVAREYDFDVAGGSWRVAPDFMLCAPELRSQYSGDGRRGASRDRQFAFA
jgi:hypothetical protein